MWDRGDGYILRGRKANGMGVWRRRYPAERAHGWRMNRRQGDHHRGIFMMGTTCVNVYDILIQTSPNLLPMIFQKALSIKRPLFHLPLPSFSPPALPKHTSHKHKGHPGVPPPTPSSASHPAPHHSNASAPHLPF